MASAIIGLLGVIVGLAVARGYSFWAMRRAELAAAVVAAGLLGEALRALVANDGSVAREQLATTWHEHRGSLVVHMRPQDFSALSDAVLRVDAPRELLRAVTELHELFWAEHEAFILVPLAHYLSGETLSKRIGGIVGAALREARAEREGGGVGVRDGGSDSAR